MEINESLRTEEKGKIEVTKVDDLGENLEDENYEEYEILKR